MARVEEQALGGAGYTARQFEIVLNLVCSNGGACSKTQVCKELGADAAEDATPAEQQLAGLKVLDAMIAANAVALRPYSVLAKDVPATAYGPRKGYIVTAPNALAYYCWQQLYTPSLRLQLSR
jgi:hypothetical protein